VRRSNLEASCRRRLSWHAAETPHDRLRSAADYAAAHDIAADRYGEGEFLEAFEQEVADALGMQAGMFVASGGAAQLIALRVWAERRRDSRIALHARSHIELREGHGYRHFNRLTPSFIGAPTSSPLRRDLESVAGGSVLYELPLRALGGQLPSWEEWCDIQDWSRQSDIPLHLDGARLWEAAAAYAESPARVADGARSVYVSFYKGVGSTSGALLAGTREFISEARVWRDRVGARLVELYPLAIPARQNLELRRNRFPRYQARAARLAKALRSVQGVRLFPDPPCTNMFHVYFDQAPERLESARDQVARQRGLWLFGFFARGLDLGACYGEVVIGDAIEALEDAEIVDALSELIALAKR